MHTIGEQYNSDILSLKERVIINNLSFFKVMHKSEVPDASKGIIDHDTTINFSTARTLLSSTLSPIRRCYRRDLKFSLTGQASPCHKSCLIVSASALSL